LDYHKSLKFSYKMINEIMQNFYKIEELYNPYDTYLKKFVESLKYMISGNIEYHRICSRYKV
jgi:hypothetical protein